MISEWVAKKPDEHLRCIGLRWCSMCGEAAEAGVRCKPCRRRREAATYAANTFRKAKKKAYHRQLMRRLRRDPSYRRLRNRQAREWQAKQRREASQVYERAKERQRLRYRNDPAYAEAKREYWRRRHAEAISSHGREDDKQKNHPQGVLPHSRTILKQPPPEKTQAA